MTAFPTIDVTRDVWGQQLKDWLEEQIAVLVAELATKLDSVGVADLGAVRFETLPWIDVTHPTYGASGNGSTDDLTPLQSALDAVPAGGRVFFPPLNYKVTAGLTFAEGATLAGDGATIVSPSSGSATVVTVTGDGAQVLGLGVKATGTWSGNLVDVTGATDVVFERAVFDGSAATSNYSQSLNASGTSDRLVVKNCRFLMRNGSTNRGFEGVIVTDCAAVVVDNNYMIGARQRAVDIRSGSGASAGARIINNYVSNCTLQGILSWNSYTEIIGNRVESCASFGIFLTGEAGVGTTNNGSVVVGNVVTNCAGGIDCEYDVHQATISGNTVVASTGNAISVIRDCSDIAIVGNTIQNSTGSYGGITCPVYAAAQSSARILVVGNVVRGCTNSGVYLEDGLNSHIAGNDITGNGVGITVNNTYASATYGPNNLTGNSADYSLQATGKITTPATRTAGAGLNLPHGTAPTSPADGDIWTTTAGIFGRINGVTVGPLT